MPSPQISALTKEEITAAARNFKGTRKMQKWTVVVDGRELPARPLILQAAGVAPNDATNSHQAIAILQQHGFEVRYQGKTLAQEDEARRGSSELEDLIRKLRGSLRGPFSLLDDREREHRIEKK